MRVFFFLAVIIVSASMPLQASSQETISPVSFDCNGQNNKAEQSICTTAYLAKLDIQLSQLYEATFKLTDDIGQRNKLKMKHSTLSEHLAHCGTRFDKDTIDRFERKFRVRDCIALIYLDRLTTIGEVVPKKPMGITDNAP